MYFQEQPKITSFMSDSNKGSSKSTGMPCIVCKKISRPGSIYCSEDCIGKHAQNALISTKLISSPKPDSSDSSKKQTDGQDFDKKIQTSHILKNKHDRVIVFEKETGRCIAGANAPTIQNLKQFLKENPTFQVVTPGSAQSEAIKAKKKQLNEVAKKMRDGKDSFNLFSQPTKIQTKLKIGEQQKLMISSPKSGDEKPKKISNLKSPNLKSPTTPSPSHSKQNPSTSTPKLNVEKKQVKRQQSIEIQKTTPPSRDERDNDSIRIKSKEGLQVF